MTVSFIDVNEGFWAYDDIREITNTFLSDGTAIMNTMPYQVFEEGKRRIYQEIIATDKQIKFTISKSVTPSTSNPLYVFIDGVQYSYKSVKTNKTTTEVTLNQPVKKGQVVSFLAPGVPKLENGRPILKTEPYHPHYLLKHASIYTYFAGSSGRGEYLTVFGKQLKRAVVDENDISKGLSEQALARKYIGYKNDRYIVSPKGRLMLPHTFEGMSGNFIYYTLNSNGVVVKRTEKFTAYSGTASDTATEPYFTDRFFPNAPALRWEVVAVINRLRKYYLERLTDIEPTGPNLEQEVTAFTGQKVFKMNTYYESGAGNLRVKVLRTDNGEPKWSLLKLGEDYEEFDDYTVLMKRPQEKGTVLRFEHEKLASKHLIDVGRNGQYEIINSTNGNSTQKVNGTTSDWVSHVLAVEHERLNNGSLLINGKGVTSAEITDSGKSYRVKVDKYLRPMGAGKPVQRFFMPYTVCTRGEAAGFVSRFRRWFIERFS